jgi:hypothetical protein
VATPRSAMLVGPSDLTSVWIPRQALSCARPCHRYQHHTPAVRLDVVPKLPMLVAGTKRATIIARPSTTAPPWTTPAPVGANRLADHCLSRQEAPCLVPLLRDRLPGLLRSCWLAVSPRPLLHPRQTSENAGSIPLVCSVFCFRRLQSLPPVRFWSAPLSSSRAQVARGRGLALRTVVVTAMSKTRPRAIFQVLPPVS